MIGVVTFPRILKDHPALFSFSSSAILIVLLCLMFVPRWETSDDIHMSMIAHGYGIAAQGSPNLIYSNVLWGYLVRYIPAFHNILGYSWATMGVLLAVGWALLYFLLRLGAGYPLSLLAVVLVVTRPILFSQFTINAGLLTVAAVIGWRVYARFKSKGALMVACILAFCGYLVRSPEFFLVLGVALPLLPWQALRHERPMQIAFAVLVLAIAMAAAFDHAAYSGPEWKAFNELHSARVPFSDYGAGEYIKQRPEILARYGYSENDIDLVSNNFFSDPKIANPVTLRAMSNDLGPLFVQKGSVSLGLKSIKALFVPELIPLIFSGLLLFFMALRKSVALAWVLFLTVLFAIGMAGRPGILRVYIPLLSLLLVAPLAFGELKKGARKWIAVLILLVACTGSIYLYSSVKVATRIFMRQSKKDIRVLPPGVTYIWGGPFFPYEPLFPVLSNDPMPRKMKLDPLYIFSYAPFSVSVVEQKAGRGLIKRLCSAEGVPVITSEERVALLGIYCRERLNGHLQGAKISRTPTITLRKLRCVTAR